MEELNIEKQEKEKKYELPEGNIIALDENSEIRKKNINYYKGLKEEGIDWTVEFQGSGISDYEKKEFIVWHPIGDIFISFTIDFHELGHLRQGEIDERFSKKNLGSPQPDEQRAEEYGYEIEEDAWQRGWERAKKYCSKELEEIEKKFQEFKKEGKFNEFENFKDFYRYVVKVILTVVKFNNVVEEKENPSIEDGKDMGKLIKSNKLTKDFFMNQEKWRTGEKIDKDFAKGFIKKAAEGIAEEEY